MASSKRDKNKKAKNSLSGIVKDKKNTMDFSETEPDEYLLNESEIRDAESISGEEDDYTFLEEIKRFENEHKKSKIVNVFKLIGKPKFRKIADTDNDSLKSTYEKFISLLDEKNIIVHFKNDYPLKEKYRFITEEIFGQDVEDVSNTNLHINFIYEDFHPEMDEEDEEEF
jgi:hypothetical protein